MHDRQAGDGDTTTTNGKECRGEKQRRAPQPFPYAPCVGGFSLRGGKGCARSSITTIVASVAKGVSSGVRFPGTGSHDPRCPLVGPLGKIGPERVPGGKGWFPTTAEAAELERPRAPVLARSGLGLLIHGATGIPWSAVGLMGAPLVDCARAEPRSVEAESACEETVRVPSGGAMNRQCLKCLGRQDWYSFELRHKVGLSTTSVLSFSRPFIRKACPGHGTTFCS